jgi:micrococcal nuclease
VFVLTHIYWFHFLLGALPTLAFADFSGPVVSVLDGDSIEVLHTNRAEGIRLNGIDCPERGQAYGKRAKQAATDLVLEKDVVLQRHGRDKYRRTISDVLLSDGQTSIASWSSTAIAGRTENIAQ